MSREIQQRIIQYLSGLREYSHLFNPDGSAASTDPSHNPGPATNRREPPQPLEELYDLIYDYNRNIAAYQHNISHMLRMVEDTQQSQYIGPILQRIFQEEAENTQRRDQPPRTYAQAASRRPTPNISRLPIFYMPISSNQRNTIRLSQREIQLATRTFTYSLSGDVTTIDTRCPISWDDFQEGDELCQILGCRHTFKSAPLMDWFGQNTFCPVCRYNVLDYRPQQQGVRDLSNQTPPQNTENPISREYASLNRLFQSELGNNETFQQIANIFSDFMSNPADSSYVLDASNNASQYRFDFIIN